MRFNSFISIEEETPMTSHDLLAILEEGLKNGRIAPHLAAYIAAEVLDTEPYETGYNDWAPSDETEELAEREVGA